MLLCVVSACVCVCAFLCNVCVCVCPSAVSVCVCVCVSVHVQADEITLGVWQVCLTVKVSIIPERGVRYT